MHIDTPLLPAASADIDSPPSAAPPRPDGWWVGYIAGCARGVITSRRRALCAVIEARFGRLDAPLRRHIEACERLSVLDAWLHRAATAGSLEAIWRGEGGEA